MRMIHSLFQFPENTVTPPLKYVIQILQRPMLRLISKSILQQSFPTPKKSLKLPISGNFFFQTERKSTYAAQRSKLR